jgi:hypothetical protein
MIRYLVLLLSLISYAYTEEIILRTGEKLTYTKILKIEADGLRLIVPDGVKKLSFEDMSDVSRAKYGLTEGGAEVFRAKQEEKMKQAEAESEQEEKEAAQANEEKLAKLAKTPKIVTLEQVKASWIQRLPKPRSLEQGYRTKIEAYNAVISGINTGQYDLIGAEVALNWNISEYERTGQVDLAERARNDLVAVRQKAAEAAKLANNLAEAKIRAEAQQMQTLEISALKREIQSLNLTLRQFNY